MVKILRSRRHRWRGISRPDLCWRWPAWLVATAPEDACPA